jgi:hypothetical protein
MSQFKISNHLAQNVKCQMCSNKLLHHNLVTSSIILLETIIIVAVGLYHIPSTEKMQHQFLINEKHVW